MPDMSRGNLPQPQLPDPARTQAVSLPRYVFQSSLVDRGLPSYSLHPFFKLGGQETYNA